MHRLRIPLHWSPAGAACAVGAGLSGAAEPVSEGLGLVEEQADISAIRPSAATRRLNVRTDMSHTHNR